MGRYYEGDINGKFWFAVQPSNAADRFGCVGEARYLNYYFCEDDLPKIKEELEVIKKNLGEYLQKIEDYFKKQSWYNDQEMAKALGITEEKLRYYLNEYADLELGKKIKECVEENGECQFDAEL